MGEGIKNSYTPENRIRWRLHNKIIFFLISAIIVLSVFPYGSENVWFEAIFCSVIFLTAGFSLLRGTYDPDGDLRIIVLPLLLLAIFSFLQGVSGVIFAELRNGSYYAPFAYDSFRSFWSGFKILSVVTFVLVLAANLRNNVRPLIMLLIISGMSFAGFGLCRFVVQAVFPGRFSYFILPALKPGVGFGPFLNQNHFAFLMLMTLGLSLCIFLSGKLSVKTRMMLLGGCLMTWVALVLTGSRAGIISSFVVVSVSVLLGLRKPIGEKHQRLGVAVRIALFAVLAMILAGGVIFIGQDRVIHRFGQLPSQLEESVAKHGFKRMDVYLATFDMIGNHPFFGVGFGSFRHAVSEFIDISGIVAPEEAHNDYLEFAASGGIVAVALAVWFFISLWRSSRGAAKRAGPGLEAAARTGAICGISGVAFHSLFDFGLQIFANLLFCTALVFLIAQGNNPRKGSSAVRKRFILSESVFAAAIILCGLLAFSSLVYGYVRYSTSETDKLSNTGVTGVPVIPYDAESYRAASQYRKRQGDYEGAAKSLKRAVSYRPRDYELWLELGQLQEPLQRYREAAGSYQQAVDLAPNYSKPAFHLGRVLHKTGEKEQAFRHLRFAYRRDPRYFEDIAELAEKDSNGDDKELIKLLSPLNAPETVMLGQYFYLKKRFASILDLTCNNESANQSLRNSFSTRLIEAREYALAYRVLKNECEDKVVETGFVNGNFESGEILEGLGFGWRAPESTEAVKVGIVPMQSKGGSSLRVRFNGPSNPGTPVLSQLIVVDPSTDYRVNFYYRTEGFTSRGVPIVSLAMRGSENGGNVASFELSTEATGWTRASIPIRSGNSTEVLDVRIKRTPCRSKDCPAFGNLFLDDFSVIKEK